MMISANLTLRMMDDFVFIRHLTRCGREQKERQNKESRRQIHDDVFIDAHCIAGRKRNDQ